MRLTLRTLLAYIDDRLPPANAKEIGQKIANSPFAIELAERIRTVVRRRRLAAPDQPQPTIDANLIAEYLDDQLTPAMVTRIEQEILRSDAILAEVAAAHEILGLIREPVDLEPAFRDRLYAMEPSGRLEVALALSAHQPQAPESLNGIDVGAASSSASTEWKPMEKASTSSRRLPLLILLGIAVLWVLVVYNDLAVSPPAGVSEPKNANQLVAANSGPAGTQKSLDPQVPESALEQPAPSGATKPVDPTKAVDPTKQADKPAETGSSDQSGSEISASTEVASTEVPATASDKPASKTAETHEEPASESTDSPATTTLPPKDATETVKPATAPADTEVAAVEGDAVETDAAKLQPESTDADVDSLGANNNEEHRRIFLVDDYRMAMILDTETGWVPASSVAGREVALSHLALFDWRNVIRQRWLGISAPYRLRISPDGAGWSAELHGNAIGQVINNRTGGFNLLEGRALIIRDPAVEPENPENGIPVVFVSGNSEMTMNLLTPDTKIAVEAEITLESGSPLKVSQPDSSDADATADQTDQNDLQPGDSGEDADTIPDAEQKPESDSVQLLFPSVSGRTVSIYVAEGRVSMLLTENEPPMILERGRSLAWTVSPDGNRHLAEGRTGLTPAPEWVFSATADSVTERKNSMTRVADAVAGAKDFSGQIAQLATEKNNQTALTAVSMMSLTRNTALLITTLLNSENEQIRRAAIDGLQKIAIETPEGRSRLSEELETRLPMADVEITERLICGLSEVEAGDPQYCQILIGLLSHERAAIRELTFYRMEKYSRDRLGYHADAEIARRKDAIRRWQKFLDRNQKTLVP